MPYVPEHKAETRLRILDSARRLFNRNGLSAISIDEVMAGAGLTRGGFYSYFDSKEELVAEAITHFINGGPNAGWQRMAFADRPEGRALARAILDAYLSRDHLDDVDGSCPVVGLATDVARSSGPVKRAYRQVMEMMLAKVTREELEFLGGLLEDGRLMPVIERTYGLRETAEAFDQLGQGHAQGKLVVAIG